MKTVDQLSVNRRQPVCQSRNGLTLLELVAVVLLLGLIASVSAIGFGSSLKAAQSQQSLETWLFYDQQCRTLADRSNQLVVLTYNPKQKSISRSIAANRPEQQTLANDVELIEIANLRSASADPPVQRNQVRYFPTGQSEPYLVRQTDTETRLVLGATGQHSMVKYPEAIREFFADD